MSSVLPSRRSLLIASAALLASPAALAELLRTPRMTEGPFYPRQMPLDDDNDLTKVKGQSGVAEGEILDFAGRVLDDKGRSVKNALVEIWQCNAYGVYHLAGDSGKLDPNFQGFGKVATDGEGRYRFRTIKPVPYSGRTPHIHYKVKSRDFGEFTSQVLIAGDPGNERDGIFRSIRGAEERKRVLMELKPAAANSGAKLATDFDIVVG
jgi:protocatechuate 3,4-dioxygenase, beta subunit